MRQLSRSRFPIAQRTRFHSPRHHRHLPRGKNQGSNRRLRASIGTRWTAPWILGLLDDALPLFATAQNLPRAGVLLAIPALLASGLLSAAEEVYGSLRPSFS